MMCDSVSELFSKVAALDKNTLAAVVFGLLLGIVLIKSILTSIFAKRPTTTFRCARCRREVPHTDRTIAQVVLSELLQEVARCSSCNTGTQP